ncbi:NAD(P)H-binding protein [Streptomyces orinoci]|uniref:NAD(P)H-binding protein n=1 Tax=Streptomyces orinoci TaxID=67339 RepID=A0ABV3K0X4_STRON|nr:NAD(P)H-binding protein [Streptomyces orinoci]
MLLVTGATGTVGREVIKLLAAAGQKVTAVTRTPDAARLSEGVTVHEGDPSRPQTLAPVLAGADAILLSPRAVGTAVGDLLGLAVEHGVRRVVVLSAVTVEYGGGYRRFAEAFRAVEDTARASGLDWTFLRCADFAANSLAWAPQIRATGTVRGASAAATTSPIHQRDIGAVAVRALLEPGHAGQAYALTGPQALTQRDRARIIGQAIGATVTFEETPPELVRQSMLAQGLPQEVADRMLGYNAACLEQPGPTTNTVARLLGRPALTFADWAAENAAAFRN